MSGEGAYLRYPSIRGDRVALVAEDDVWLAPADGGRALAADRRLGARSPAPDCPRTARWWPTPAPATASPRCTSLPSTAGRPAGSATGATRSPGRPGGRRTAGWWRARRPASRSAAGSGPGRCRSTAGVPERLPYGPVNTVGGRAGRGDGAGRRPEPAGRRHLEALPRRHRRQALDRPGRRRRVPPAARRARRPAGGPRLGRRAGGLPVRPRGLGQRLLGAPGRHRPAPAHRPRRVLRPGDAHRRHAGWSTSGSASCGCSTTSTRRRGRAGWRSRSAARAPAGSRTRSRPASRSATSPPTAPAGPARSRCSAPCTG